jgi:hypothetical protein
MAHAHLDNVDDRYLAMRLAEDADPGMRAWREDMEEAAAFAETNARVARDAAYAAKADDDFDVPEYAWPQRVEEEPVPLPTLTPAPPAPSTRDLVSEHGLTGTLRLAAEPELRPVFVKGQEKELPFLMTLTPFVILAIGIVCILTSVILVARW